MAPWDPFIAVSGVGAFVLLSILGVLALVLPGRLDRVMARPIGLGPHVEGILILSFATTAYSSAGIGNIPVYIDRNGVVAFSLIGAVFPTLLSVYFLLRSGPLRFLGALVGVAGASAAAYAVSRPVEELGIVSEYPAFFLPSAVAALAGTLLAPLSVRAVPLAYACGTLGGLIGGDLVRFEWVLSTRKAVAGSFGGAESFDLVFLAGLWGAAFAALPLAAYWARLRHADARWESVAALAARGEHRAALQEGTRLVTHELDAWAADRGMAGRPAQELRAASDSEPVLAQVEAAVRAGPALTHDQARTVLERLESLHRRLQRPPPARAAPPGRRVAAAAIDLAVPAVLAVLAVVLAPSAPPAPRAFFGLSVFVSAHVLYPAFAEWIFAGATLGKALTGLRVRRRDGGRAGGWACLVRNLGRLLDLALFYFIPLAAPAASGRPRLGDYFAETVVVDARATATSTPVTAAPTATAIHAGHGTAATSRAPR